MEIKQLYSHGERDFSHVDCRSADFDNLVLEGCDFSHSNLSYSSFRSTNLRNCNFTSATVDWSNFTRADLREADMTKANFSYSSFSNANMENTILMNTDLRYCLFFGVVQTWQDKGGNNFHEASFNEAELSKKVTDQIQLQVMSMKGILPHDVYMRLTFAAHDVGDKAGKINVQQEERRGNYTINASTSVGYGAVVGQDRSVNVGYSTGTGEVGYQATGEKKKHSAYDK